MDLDHLITLGTNSTTVSGIMMALLYDVLKSIFKIIVSKATHMTAKIQPSIKKRILSLIGSSIFFGLCLVMLWSMPTNLDKTGVMMVVFFMLVALFQFVSMMWHAYILVMESYKHSEKI